MPPTRSGLSGPGRLHDLFVTHEAMSPGEWKSGGEGTTIHFGFHPSPFGSALVMATGRGLAGLAFADPGKERATLADMKSRWPRATYVEDSARTATIAKRIFDPAQWQPQQPLRVVLIGTDFEVRVWDALLQIPMGRLATYSGIAAKLAKPNASRAVGAAVGKNPVSFVVPCHRVVGKSGDLTGYHWGITRKRAMLGWEAGRGRRRGVIKLTSRFLMAGPVPAIHALKTRSKDVDARDIGERSDAILRMAVRGHDAFAILRTTPPNPSSPPRLNSR